MKRALQFAWLLLLATTAAAAQVVSVQATVTDPNGVPYAGGTVSTSLVSSQPEFLNGVQYAPPPVAGLSATGRFNLQLADNNVLQPAGSTYSMTVCSSTTGTVPPFSRTPTCFTATGIAVTGVFVDLSSLLSSQSTLLNVGGGGSPGGSTNALQYNGGSTFSGLNSPTTNGNCIVSFNVTTSASTAPNCSLPGVAVNAQSGSYALAYSDRAAYLKFSGGTTATLTLCQIATNCASNFPFVVQNFNSGALTITANAADKIDGGSLGGSITLSPNQAAFIYQDSSSAPGNWWSLKLNNTTSSRQAPLIAGGANCTTTSGTTVFFKIASSVTCNSTEVQSRTMLPFTGTVTNLCVNIGSTQSATGSLTFTIKDETTGSTSGTISLVIAAGSGAGTYCDNSGSSPITAQHEYDVVMVNGASATSANINGFSSIYAY